MSDNTMNGLREHLFATLQGLRDGSIKADQAKAICEVSQTIVNTAKVEADYAKATGQRIDGIIKTQPPALPAAAPAALGNQAPHNGAHVEKTSHGTKTVEPGVTRHQMR